MKNIIVMAAACRTSGALSIYRQFLNYLSIYIGENRYYIFIDPSMDQPMMKNVEYIYKTNHSWFHRIAFDYYGIKCWFKQRNITPDLIVSFQNTGILTNCRQLIYYHQPIPFFSRSWNFFLSSERNLFLYKHIYPYFVQNTLNKKTDVIVQIPFIKKGFINRFNIEPSRVHVLFPDVEKIDLKSIDVINLEKDCFHFIYPAVAFPYKEHATLVKALTCLKKRNEDLVNRIRIHLTISSEENNKLNKLIKLNRLEKQFVMHGKMLHKNLLSMYKSSCGLLFPSTIETLGLPLLEAAAFGLPIIAANLDYAHEVLADYPGVQYISVSDFESWGNALEYLCNHPVQYQPMVSKASTWPTFFKLIN